MNRMTLGILGGAAFTALVSAIACSGDAHGITSIARDTASGSPAASPRAGAGPATPESPIDPRVADALTNMAQALANAKTLSFTALSTTEDVSSGLEKLQFDTSMRGAMKRPDKLFLEKTGAENTTLWFDGQNVTILDRTLNTYMRAPVTDGLDGLIAELDKLDVEAPFGGLLRSDLEQAVEKVAKGSYYGPSPVDGTPCHHLALRQDNVDWQVWIDTSTNLLKKAVITSKMLAAAPEHQIFVKEAHIDEAVDDATFAAELPKGAQEAQAGNGK
jgi:hypothetical protein